MTRILGHVFNPLTIYFCYDVKGSLKVIIYEVKNKGTIQKDDIVDFQRHYMKDFDENKIAFLFLLEKLIK